MTGPAALLDALASASAALEVGDAPGASAALARAEAARDGIAASGTQLAPEELARARGMHAACVAAAARVQASLLRALGLAGRSHRACVAYRR